MRDHLILFSMVASVPSLALAALIAGTRWKGWMWFIKLTVLIFIVGVLACYVSFRASAKLASTNTSPDGRYKVLTYRLPNFSMTPGGGSDGPAYAELLDQNGKVLRHVEFEMLQCAEVEWHPNTVNIGPECIDLK